MANLSITASQVLTDLGQPATYEQGVAGEAISAGDLVYLDAATGNYLLTDANDLSPVLADVRGMALNTAAANQPLRIQRTGRLTLGAGAAPVVGQLYVASATAGKSAPASDLASGWHSTLVFVGYPTNQIQFTIIATGQALP